MSKKRKEPSLRPGNGIPGFLREMKRDLIIDCFAGGGGASVGIEMALGRSVDIAINHDPDAILMHKRTIRIHYI